MVNRSKCHHFKYRQFESNLKAGEFLDDFGYGVNGLGIGEQAVGDGCDDVKGTFQ